MITQRLGRNKRLMMSQDRMVALFNRLIRLSSTSILEFKCDPVNKKDNNDVMFHALCKFKPT